MGVAFYSPYSLAFGVAVEARLLTEVGLFASYVA